VAFEYALTARFHEVDRVGIVFFARAYEYAHICFEELLAAAFGEVSSVFERHGFGMPLVHTEASYRSPIRHGDRLRVRGSIDVLSERSATFRYEVLGADDDLRCTVRLKHAFVHFPSFEPIAVPQAFTEGMQHIELIP
jgi:acyl-CoA thioester hydrolase